MDDVQDLQLNELAELKEAPVVGLLPPEVALSERAVAALRAYLESVKLPHYRIFYSNRLDLVDVDDHLDALGESAAWESAGAVVAGGEALAAFDELDGARVREGGYLRLSGHQVVLARWFWADAEGDYLRQLWLCAAPSAEQYRRLHERVLAHRRRAGAAVWQVVSGCEYRDRPRIPRDRRAGDELVLPASLVERVEGDIVRFFTDEVVKLYRSLRVPHRRGVLLHGPPGNGKTSLIRLIGARLSEVPALILRPDASFDVDDLQVVVDRWSSQAPAILVIEDLNWLLERVNVSNFLNMLDGIDRGSEGLLLIATTNHPEALDPAINNRPGRFDVVIEVGLPDESLRRRFLARHLPDLESAALDRAAGMTSRLSFAHLEEVLRLSGLLAIDAGRDRRTDEDVLRAVKIVRGGHEAVAAGFGSAPEAPFGLHHLREIRRSEG